MPSTFYAFLDSVRFDERTAPSERIGQRQLTAATCVMVDLLVSRTRPVLSENQALDNAYLLDLLARRDDDALAFLRLVKRGLVQVRLLDHDDLLPAAGVAERFSVVNAFRSKLAAKYTFSAWPELVEEAARQELSEALRRRSVRTLDGTLAERAGALLSLDEALRQSEVSERARSRPPLSLSALVREHLNGVPQASPTLLGKHAERFQRLVDENHDRYDLERRTCWYDAIRDYADDQRIAAANPVLDQLKGLVDVQYNRLVAGSLDADRVVDEQERPDVAEVLRDTLGDDASLDEQASALLPVDSRDRWLEWRDIPERFDRSEFDPPERRLDELVQDRLVERIDEHAALAFVRASRGGAVAATAGLVGGVLAGPVGAPAGAVLGVALAESIASVPRLRRPVDRLDAAVERMARRFAGARVRKTSQLGMPPADR